MSFSFFVSSLFIYSGISRVDLHAAFAAPDEDENAFPLTYTSPTRGEEKFKKVITGVAVHGSHFTVFTG
ncbi:MAG: hypothetical protein GX428_03720 [Candidatus Atribacteria bacterium]|nr:hypothetical protein [Candidatus Atribacteria bacterium]